MGLLNFLLENWEAVSTGLATLLIFGIRIFKATDKGVGLLTMISGWLKVALKWIKWGMDHVIQWLEVAADAIQKLDVLINKILDQLKVPEKTKDE